MTKLAARLLVAARQLLAAEAPSPADAVKARNLLRLALIQASPKDDQIIMGHIREAYELLGGTDNPKDGLNFTKAGARVAAIPRGDETAYTATQTIHLPDVEVDQDDPSYIYVPLRGYSSVMAVFDQSDECIGWILSERLGYPTVKDWIKATGWIDQGY